MISIAVNARFRDRPLTGVERFATEVCRELASSDTVELRELAPSSARAGLAGHAWEQFRLPGMIDRDEILLSPCNTGPVRVKRQFPIIHDAAVWESPETFGSAFRRFYQALLPRLANRCPAIGTVSEFSRKQLAQHLRVPEEKIHVLGNAISSDFCPPSEYSESNTLLCVGSLDPRKNFSRLLLAWQSLQKHKRLPHDSQLDIVGAANPRNFSHVAQEKIPGVNWLGRISDEELIRNYQNAKAFIFPSLYEGFGLPPLEAMACGCPVLLSHAASIPEVGGAELDLSDSQSTGAALYFDPLSESEIADAIEKVYHADEGVSARWKKNAINRASQFSWKAIAEKTETICRAL